MSGPIVRSGPSPKFSENWESIFGKKSKGAKATKKAAAKARSAKKAAPKKKKGRK